MLDIKSTSSTFGPENKLTASSMLSKV